MVEGACATSLLATGGQTALVAIQTASIVAAFPYTIILNVLCVAIYAGLTQEERGDNYDPPQFSIGLLDFVTTWKVSTPPPSLPDLHHPITPYLL